MAGKVAVFTAKEPETRAFKKLLSKPIRKEVTSRHEIYHVYNLSNFPDGLNNTGSDVEIAVYETGRGQHNSLLYTESVIDHFKPDYSVFLGCAGGEPGVINAGDIYIATKIYPAEIGKEAKISFKSRGIPHTPDRALLDTAKSVEEFGTWRNMLPAELKDSCRVHFQPIASGDKVVVHNRSVTWRRVKSIDDEISAVETEGHGFFSGVTPHKGFAIMVRGISDIMVDKDSRSSAELDFVHYAAKQSACVMRLSRLGGIFCISGFDGECR